MTSKRSVAAILKRARLRTEPFTVALGDETIDGTITQLPFTRWQEIQASHPVRPDNSVDAGWGYSYVETWPDMIRACVCDPALEDDEWPLFFDLLGEGDLARLAVQIIALNERPGSVDVPKPSSTSPETTTPSSD